VRTAEDHEENQLLEGAPAARERSAGPEGPHYLSYPALVRGAKRQLPETASLQPQWGSTSQDLMVECPWIRSSLPFRGKAKMRRGWFGTQNLWPWSGRRRGSPPLSRKQSPAPARGPIEEVEEVGEVSTRWLGPGVGALRAPIA
jgi:hypothetical protein